MASHYVPIDFWIIAYNIASSDQDASSTKADTIMTEADMYMIETDTLRHIGHSGKFAGRRCIIVFLKCHSR